MIRSIRILSLVVLLLIAAQLHAQVTPGTPPFGSYAGGPDVVDLSNLNVHFTIPVLDKAGRGLPFDFYLTYDTSIWYPSSLSGPNTWTQTTNFGWNGSELKIGYITYGLRIYTTPVQCTPKLQGHTVTYVYNWAYVDGFSTSHLFPGTSSTTVLACTGATTSTSGGGTSQDGSGYTLSATGDTVNQLTAPDGNLIASPVNTNTGSGRVQDRNGNQISVSSSNVFTDTLGTTALTLTGSGTPSSPYVYAYPAPSGANALFTVKYTTYSIQTNFGCSGVVEYGANGTTTANLVSEIDLPDGSKYTFAYEPTLGHSGFFTGRPTSITLPTGGTITYGYSGGKNGINCADGTTAILTRQTPDGIWKYSHTPETGAASITTVTDATSQANQTLVQFQGLYETQRDIYQGAAPTVSTFPIPETTLQTSGLLKEIQICYNTNTTNCTSTAITTPITQRNITTHLSGASSWANSKTSGHIFKYNSAGSLIEQDDYDYGSGSLGALLKKTTKSYATLTNITAFPQQVTVTNGTGATVSQVSYSYGDTVTAASGTPQHTTPAGSRGNLLSVNYYTQGSAYLTKSYTYFDTGNVQTSTDVNGAQMTYTYGPAGCPNSFPTNLAEPLSLSRSMTWNCTGGVQTSVKDENGNISSTGYATDPYYWRPNTTTDAEGNQTNFTYQPNPSYALPFEVERTLTFNNGNSEASDIQYEDGLGRTYVDQHMQTPNSSTLDSVSYTFDSNGRPYTTSMPCSVGWAGTCSTSKITTTYDALNRVAQITDGGGGTITDTYSQNDVLVVRGPAPTGENTKQHQSEYDGLGRLTSVCEITSVAGSGACSQTNSQTGFWTKYTYDALGRLTGVTQNAQSSLTQSRAYAYDLLGRMTSETEAESGTTTYTYDTDSTCGISKGDLVKRVDAVGNVTCIAYDALHRRTSITYPTGSYSTKSPSKYFVYDSATVNNVGMSNTKGQLAEAYTCVSPCSAKITDIGLSYTVRGEPSDVYESTPNSGGYYHVAEQYWANGAIKQLSGLSSLPTFTFNPDGKGRISTVTASTGQNPVTNAAFNSASLPTSITFGSTDTDSFTYDPNTNRITQYQFTVNGTSLYGALGWNANGSLQSQNITDGLNAADNQACGYAYDDLVRLVSANCTGQLLQNPGFEQGLTAWNTSGTVQLISDPTRAHSGNDYVQVSAQPNSASSVAGGTFAVTTGEQIVYGGWGYLESGSGCCTRWILGLYDTNYNYIGNSTGTVSDITSASWTYSVGTYTVASNVAYVQLYAEIYMPTTASVARFDDAFLGMTPAWSQSFSYDVFGNIAKSGSSTFAASYYSATNQISSVGGFTPTYDANGNTLTDPAHTYSWDSAGKPVLIDNVNMTYDAMGRMVEQNRSGAYTQFVYGPHGGKFAIMSGQALQKAIIPLVGGAQAVYNASGLLYYGHSDHLGSIRLGSTPSRTMSFDIAYAPFGETYASSGSTDSAFTGQRQDTVDGLFDFPAREYSNEGRWSSPDPSGAAAFHLIDPQTINRYVYARNTPLSIVDPTGLYFPCQGYGCTVNTGTSGGGIGSPEGDPSGNDPTSGGSQGNSGGGCGADDPACAGISGMPGGGGPDPLNNPLAPQGPGPGPGDSFSNLIDAGIIASIYAYYHVGEEGLGEYGGAIYQNPNGTYSFTVGQASAEGADTVDTCPTCIPDGTQFVTDYHSHGQVPDLGLESFSTIAGMAAIGNPNSDELTTLNHYMNYPNSYVGGFLSTPLGNIQFMGPLTFQQIHITSFVPFPGGGSAP